MRPRGRPKKYRIVETDPKISQFSPRGRPGRPDEVELTRDEFEALRLADQTGLNQKTAAKSMKISQQTFSRIIKRAHRIIADGLIKGATIKIQGGNYILNNHTKDTKHYAKSSKKSSENSLKNLSKSPI